MAQVHYVSVGLVKVDPTGVIIDGQTPMKKCLNFSTEHRVVPDAGVPSSANYPTIKEYLEAEAIAGFEPKAITQSFIVTWHS